MTHSEAFIGREAMVAALVERHTRAQRGEGGAVFVRGEPGVGKTRLLREVVRTLALPPERVLWTAALDYAPSRFAPIADAAEKLQALRPGLLGSVPRLRLAIERIVRADDGEEAQGEAQVRRFFDGSAELFRVAAADEPLLLIIDDLHHADSATLSLLYHITAATRDCAFLVLASYRAGDELRRPSLLEPWARLDRLGNAETLTLPALSEDETATLIRSLAPMLPREARTRIATRAEGNALFAHELVRQALSTQGRSAAVPRSISQAVLDRYEGLSEAARSALRYAAVVGRTFDCRLVADCARVSLPALLDVLREAIRCDLIDETNNPDIFRFRHALAHEAIYGELLAAQRRDTHRRVLELLEQRAGHDPDYANLAAHAHLANQPEAAVRYGRRAGDQLRAKRAYESAIEQYERARERAVTADDSAELDKKIASAWMMAGFPDRAIAPATSALAQYRAAGDTENSAALFFLLAECAGQSGADERRLELLDDASRLLSSATQSRFRAKHWFCRSEIALANNDAPGVIASSTTAISENDIDVDDALALCNVRAHALLMQREYDRAIEAQSDAVRIAVATAAPDVIGNARFGLGIILALSGHLERAGSAFQQAAVETASALAITESSMSVGLAAEMALMLGDVVRARSLFEDVLPQARRRDRPSLIVQVARVGLFLGLRTGDRALARRVVDALELDVLFADRTPERFFPLSGAYAQFLVAEGRHEEARDVLRRAVCRLSDRRLRSTDWSPCSVLTVAEHGDEADFAAARRPIADWFTPFGPAFLKLFDALTAKRFGLPGDAVQLADRAASEFHHFGFFYEEGMALHLAGRSEEALEIFGALGSQADVLRIRDELTPKNRQGRRHSELTAREREVAQLVAGGATNRAISDRLSVSEKTVETHISSIFSKLGVRARGDIAGRLEAVSAERV